MSFDHERLDVYRAALDFTVAANDIAQALPRGRGYLVDQLQRAATSVVLNIAEGAGEFCGTRRRASTASPNGRRQSARPYSTSACACRCSVRKATPAPVNCS